MSNLDAYKFYFYQEHIPFFMCRLLQFAFYILAISGIIVLLPLIGHIGSNILDLAPYNNSCYYTDHYMHEFDCYVIGILDVLLLCLVMTLVFMVTISIYGAFKALHEHIIKNNSELNEKVPLIRRNFTDTDC